MQTWALLGLLIYFNLLMGIVLAGKHNQTQEDYFFAGRELPFLALSMTFVASWWSAGLALSTANLVFNDCLGAFVYHGTDESLVALYDPQDELLSARYCSLAGKWLSMMIFCSCILNAAMQRIIYFSDAGLACHFLRCHAQCRRLGRDRIKSLELTAQ